MTLTKIDNPISMRWKVSQEKIQKFLQSEPYYITKFANFTEIHGLTYRLVIKKYKENEISVGLGLGNEERIIINAKYKISITSKNIEEEFCEEFCGKKRSYGGIVLCSFEGFFDPANGYFIDDYISITMEGILTFEKEKEICDNFEIKSSTNLGEILYNRDDKDFKIYCKNGNSVK
uniref:Uncharacterized protein n=1 Tax=Panagrolaimus sp. PS1159 TaxID=55785 RepID=A0AC35G9B7_9BILA